MTEPTPPTDCRWTFVSEDDPKQTEVCVLCGDQRDVTGPLPDKARITGGWPGHPAEPTPPSDDDPRYSYNQVRAILVAHYARAVKAQEGPNAEAARGGVIAITDVAGDLGIVL
ncbi:MAG TPA: hypothetical protein VGQ45_03900 [Gaiellales bacterium]|jgi:hypothetical protein|nr:hypothetical protein [Gaiellales bacterium]